MGKVQKIGSQHEPCRIKLSHLESVYIEVIGLSILELLGLLCTDDLNAQFRRKSMIEA